MHDNIRSLNQSLLLNKSSPLAGIYIHIPFCKKACHYCDFHFSTTLNLMDKMVEAIVKETALMKSYLNEPVETIYFGGGTPSLLDKQQLDTIVNSLYKHFSINSQIEFTLEANPDDLSRDKIFDLKSIGVNRLSIGTQSFDNKVLQFLNRSHSSEQAVSALRNAREIGINNISLDLIYGIPNQEKAQWIQNLEKLVSLDPQHISCYALTIEERTAFGSWVKKNKLIPKDDEKTGEEYDYMVDYLLKSGFEHYEVSNFAKPSMLSKHNSSYWHQKPYLGLGPGAHSFNGISRHYTITNNPKYIELIGKGEAAYTKEVLSNNEALTEYIFTRIRTKWGVDLNEAFKLYGFKLTNQQEDYLFSIVSKGLASFDNNKLVLNSKGYFLSDSIALELIPEP